MEQIAEQDVTQLLAHELWGNTVLHYLTATFFFIATYAALRLFRRRMGHQARRHPNPITEALSRIRPSMMILIALHTGLSSLTLPPKGEAAAHMILMTLVTLQLILLAGDAVPMILAQTLMRESRDKPSVQNAARNLGSILKIAIWLIGLLFILSNLGLNVGSLLAGLGIGGIAIALATQSVLGDTFSCFVLYFDRPFEVGESITLDTISGTIENIGLRTTRIRSVDGDLFVVANSDITKARVRKPADLRSRRIAFQLPLVYGTPTATLRKVPELLRQAIGTHPDTRFDRATLADMGVYSLNFDVVFHIDLVDMRAHAARLQDVYLQILETLEAAGVRLAYPTQTLECVTLPGKPV